MRDIILASPTEKVRSQLKTFLSEMGIIGVIECKTASQTLQYCRRMPSCIVICHRVTDMPPAAMARLLPPKVDMLLLISSSQEPLFGLSNVRCVTLPLSRPDFRRTIEVLLSATSDSRINAGSNRSTVEHEIIDKAKKLYMKVNCVSEQEAYAYIRRRSMNDGSTIAATAKHLLSELANI